MEAPDSASLSLVQWEETMANELSLLVQTCDCSYSGGEGRRIGCSRLPWATQYAQGQPGQFSETLFQKVKRGKETQLRHRVLA